MNYKNFEKNTENSTISFQVEVDAAAFEKAVAAAYQKNKKDIFIQGFRKGKAPRQVIEGMYGKDVFYDDAVNEIAYEAFEFGAKEAGTETIGIPTITDYHVADDKSCTISFTVATYPEATLGQYKELEAPHQYVEITDEDVMQEVDSVRQRNARINTVERPAQDGDTAVIDFVGFVDGKEFEGGSGSEYSLKLGSNTFIPGFEEQLVGVSAGESKDVVVTFPEDYEPSLAGKEATFKCLVSEVKETELPELDDEFVKDVSEFDTVEEYKNSIRENLKNTRQAQADDEFHNRLLLAAAENMEVTIPEAMIEEKLEEIASNYAASFGLSGISKAQFVQMMGMTEEMFDEVTRPNAERDAKVDVLLRAVAAAEGIEPTEEDIDGLVQEIADAYQMTAEEVKEKIDMDAAKNDIRCRKAAELIYSTAKDLPWSEDEAVQEILKSAIGTEEE